MSSSALRNTPKLELFGVDRPAQEVVCLSGDRYPVVAWYDPLGNQCDEPKAAVCVFQGPGGLYFAADMRDSMLPTSVQ
jgi:hypothetical protein